jgi:tetratricopeptide (TPR) repeat protein
MPGRNARVVNAGGGGTGSIQNLEVLREALDHEPDLIVVYPEGGEKNLIPPLPQGVMVRKDDASPARVTARRLLTKLRLYHGVRAAYRALLPERHEGGGGLSAFSAFALYAVSRPFAPENFTRLFTLKQDRVPPLMPHTIPQEEIDHAHARFEAKLGEMARLAQARGVPLLFVYPVRNLHASFYLRFHIDPSEIRPGEIAAWRAGYERGLEAKRAGRHAEAIEHLLAVRGHYVEDRDEILAYYLGECHEALGRPQQALAEFEKPYLRHPMRALIERAATVHGVPLVDPYPYLVRAAVDGVPGYAEFTDAFHPMPATNRTIARAILDSIRTEGLAPDARPPGAPELAAADAEVRALVARCIPPAHNAMLSAILAGRHEDAIRIGRSLPQERMYQEQITETLYLGWALAASGDIDGARELHGRLRKVWGGGVGLMPRLDSDVDIVRNAFGGDLFAWF